VSLVSLFDIVTPKPIGKWSEAYPGIHGEV